MINVQSVVENSDPQRFVVRMLRSDEWLEWRALRLQALSDAPYAYSSQLVDWQGSGDVEARWRGRLSSVPLNLVAILNDVSVGMVSATEKDQNGTVELISMWVAPQCRGRGVGDALIDALIEWAKERVAVCVSLDVKKGNKHAIALYKRHGFAAENQFIQGQPSDPSEVRFARSLEI